MGVDVVLPVLDEAAALPVVLGRMPDGFRPLVVDNGSTDGSAAVARSLGVTVIEEHARGFGSACHAGLSATISEVVCFMDCDGSLDPMDLPSVVAPVVAGDADLVLGKRIAHEGGWPWHARIANRWLARRVNSISGSVIGDIGPMRAARREALLSLNLMDRRFGYSFEMVFKAARADWRIVEVEVPYVPRLGRSKVTGTVRGTLRAINDIARVMT
jgi:glycosyltransferase involved in cell wall biosynthesis